MLVGSFHHVRTIRERAKSKAKALSVREKAVLSLSQTLFALAIAVALIAIFASYIGYGPGTLGMYTGAVALLLSLSHLAYRRVSRMSFIEYVAVMFISGVLDQEAPVGLYGSLLFLGGLFVAASPLIYTYLYSRPTVTDSPALYVAGFLIIGAVLSTIAVVWYVRKILSR